MMKCLMLLAIIGVFLSMPVLADQADVEPSSQDAATSSVVSEEAETSAQSPAVLKKSLNKSASPVGASSLLTTILSLALIVIMIIAIAWLVRRVGGGVIASSQQLKIVAALSIGAREKLLVVDVAGEQILLGVTPNAINHIKSFDQPVIGSDQASGDFANKLKGFLSTNSPVNKGGVA